MRLHNDTEDISSYLFLWECIVDFRDFYGASDNQGADSLIFKRLNEQEVSEIYLEFGIDVWY